MLPFYDRDYKMEILYYKLEIPILKYRRRLDIHFVF